MNEFISLIQFRTAIPFGYLLFSFFWLLVVVWAVTSIVRNLWAKRFSEPKNYLAAAVLFLAVGYACVSALYSENLNLNPFFSESDIVGAWEYGDSELVLFSGGQAKINFSEVLLARLAVENGEGRWNKKADFNLNLDASSVNLMVKSSTLRVIKYAESYRIIVEDYEDPDMWDGSLGFKKTNR